MSGARTLRLPAWAWPLLALPLVAGVGLWTYGAVASAMHGRLEDSLGTMLASNASALDQWLDAEANLAAVMAADPAGARGRRRACSRSPGGRRRPGGPQGRPAQAHLREVLVPAVSRQQNAGFFVFDPGGLILARIVDEQDRRAGRAHRRGRGRAGTGRAPVFLPPTLKQRFAAVPMAFLMVPVRDATGAAIAVFAFRIHPPRMAEILNASRLGRKRTRPTRWTPRAAWSPRRGSRSRWRSWACCPRRPGAARRPSSRSAIPARALADGHGCRDAAEDLAADLGGGRRRGRPVRRQRGRLPRLSRRAASWGPGSGCRSGASASSPRSTGPRRTQTLAVVRRAFGVLGGGLLLVARRDRALLAPHLRPAEGGRSERQRLGQYTLEDKIGEGGMGAVYRARHAFLRRPTAVKLIRVAGWRTRSCWPASSARCSSPASSRTRTRSRSTTTDARRTASSTTRWSTCPGLPLDGVIQDDGPQPAARVVHLVKQICASLAEAHRVGLVHRDIKPANVMLCERGRAVRRREGPRLRARQGARRRGRRRRDGGGPHRRHAALHGSRGRERRASRRTRAATCTRWGPWPTRSSPASTCSPASRASRSSATTSTRRPLPPSERLGRPVDPFLEAADPGLPGQAAGGPACRRGGPARSSSRRAGRAPPGRSGTAREWWETRAPAMLAARRATEASGSRGPKLEVDVASRMRSEPLRALARGRGDEDLHAAAGREALTP